MRILAVLYCYPPLLYPATMVNLKLVKGLAELGVGLEVVTVDPATFVAPGEGPIDPALEKLLPAAVINHRIRSWEIRRWVKALKASGLARCAPLYRFFEPRKREWTYPALRHLRRRGLDDVDLILSCSQPHCNHLLGLRLKELSGKPWVAYFSDPWTDNVYTSYPRERIFRYHLQLERKVLDKADRIFFTSQETADLVLRRYPAAIAGKCGVLPHSFVPEWYPAAPLRREPDGPIRIVQTGHFYGPRTPLPLLRPLAELAARSRLEGRIEFVFYGSMEEKYRDFLRRHHLEAVVRIAGIVPYLQTLAAMRDADYLLLIDAPVQGEGQSVFLPSKLIDYLGSGKPVLGITPPRGTSARVLRETGHLVCDIGDAQGIGRMLENLAAGTLRVNPNQVEIDGYRHLQVATRFVAGLQELTGRSAPVVPRASSMAGAP